MDRGILHLMQIIALKRLISPFICFICCFFVVPISGRKINNVFNLMIQKVRTYFFLYSINRFRKCICQIRIFLIKKLYYCIYCLFPSDILLSNFIECQPGLWGNNCSQVCVYPFFGSSCLKKCACDESLCNAVLGCVTCVRKSKRLLKINVFKIIDTFMHSCVNG